MQNSETAKTDSLMGIQESGAKDTYEAGETGEAAPSDVCG